MLSIKNLSKIYKDSDKGIKNLSLKLHPGDICAFTGANGSGKTTAIKSIVGIHTFDHGTITLDDINLNQEPEKFKALVGYAPDTPILYNNMTGQSYIELIAGLYKMTGDELNNKLTFLLKSLNFEDAIYDLVSNYSHGMKQRLILISLLMHDPKLIILDEPFVGLDPNATDFLISEINNRARNGAIILYSTHVLEVAEKICNRLVILNHGEVVLNDTMEKAIKETSLNQRFKDVTLNE